MAGYNDRHSARRGQGDRQAKSEFATQKDQLIYGKHPVLEAIRSGKSIDKLFLQRKGHSGDETWQEIVHLSNQFEIPTQYVPVQKLNKLCRNNHQGVVAFASLIPYYSVEDVLSSAYESGEPPLFLILDQVTDVRNFGSIARSAACGGAHGIIVPAKGSAAINAEAIKTSAGALNDIPVCKVRFLIDSIEYLQSNGLQVVASTLDESLPVQELDLTIPTAIIMGSEDKGVSPKYLEAANQAFRIPMSGKVDSYNVSVASGIVLYEALRQRMALGS